MKNDLAQLKELQAKSLKLQQRIGEAIFAVAEGGRKKLSVADLEISVSKLGAEVGRTIQAARRPVAPARRPIDPARRPL